MGFFRAWILPRNLEGIYDGDGGDDELGRVMENSRRIFQTLKPRKRCLTEEHG
jgi:hypothetical protein